SQAALFRHEAIWVYGGNTMRCDCINDQLSLPCCCGVRRDDQPGIRADREGGYQLLNVIGTLNRRSNHADAKRFRCSFHEAEVIVSPARRSRTTENNGDPLRAGRQVLEEL